MSLKNKKAILIAAVIVAVILILLFQVFRNGGVSIVYKTAKVDRGDILSYITTTGTLNPVTTVEVGSQVSGVIERIYVDFNSIVKKGEPLAEIDPAPFEAKLKQAQADLKKAESDAEIAKSIFKANEELYKKRLISKEEYDNSRVKYSTAVAALEQAKAEVEIAKTNLSSTTIRSPIDGVVNSRKVNVGQTVTTASVASPLFIVAEDLARMQLIAHVSEADIGKVDNNQEAVFTVDAYPNQTFSGKVWQIRNEPIKTSNVVTYDVVILVDNKDLKLKPGMTAEVKILVAHKKDVLRVPRAALRFVPPPSASIDEKSKELSSSSVIWITTKDKKLKAIPISPGISDDTFTEILDGNLKEGEEVVVEAIQRDKSNSQLLGPLPQIKRF